MGKTYVIVSGKGGTGKTTTTINLGVALSRFDNEVIIVDANLTTPNLSLYLGAPVVPVSLSHVLQKKAKIEQAIYEHDSGLKVVPSSLSLKDLKKINYNLLPDVSRKLKKISSHVLFDSGAGLGEEATSPISACDEVIVVVNPNILSITDAMKTIKIAQDMGKKVRGAIITRVTNHRSEMRISSITEMLDIPILGTVPEDFAVSESLARRNSVLYTHPRSRAARAYVDIAAKMLGKKKKPSLYAKILGNLGIKKIN